jgi:hypothetical protein
MAIDPEEKTGMLGCLAAVGAVGAVVAGVIWFSQQDFSEDPATGGAGASGGGTTLTRVDPMREKTVVQKAAKLDPLAKKVNTEDRQDEDAPVGGVTAAVRGLGQLTDQPPRDMPDIATAYDHVLASEPLCYHGKVARRAPSLFTKAGFAITYGADDYNSGNPLPRLEIFFDNPDYPVAASYLSMTPRAIPEFPAHEVPVDYDEAALAAIIARWIAAVATETCPDKAPGSGAAPETVVD